MEFENLAKTIKNSLLDTIKSRFYEDEINAESNNKSSNKFCKNIVIVCFGTPLISGDSFAPLVADALRDEFCLPVFVYGTTACPINGKNMTNWIEFVKIVHKGDVILAVDASLGDKEGGIVVRQDGVCPAAIKGRKRRFGDVRVLGVVAKNEGDALVALMGVDYKKVQNMALDAAKLIATAVDC